MLIIKAIYACNLPTIEEIMDADIPASPVVAAPSSVEPLPLSNQVTENIEKSIFDFLKFCHQNKEMEVYYLFLNEVEVKSFADGSLEIASNKGSSLNSKIEELLKIWSGQEWKLINTKQSSIVSLKEKMLEQIKNAEDYQVIKNNFPDANISDIILK